MERPWEYRWSSAAAHLGEHDASHALDLAFWTDYGGAAAWRDLIDCEEDEQQLRKLRRATYAGQPLGSEEFVASHGRPRAAAV